VKAPSEKKIESELKRQARTKKERKRIKKISRHSGAEQDEPALIPS